MVEIVACVENAVSQEFVNVSMEAVGPGPGRRADDSPGRTAILGRVISRKNRELLNRVDPEVHAESASRRTIGVVVNADAIET